MYVTVHVTAGELRGMPFAKYSDVLHNLIGERYMPDGIEIVAGTVAEVLVDGLPGTESGGEIMEMAQEMTKADVRDGYFR